MINLKLIDITELSVDAIVNAANEELQPGGGVCGAIFAKAGYEKLVKACEEIGHCKTGDARITSAHPATTVVNKNKKIAVHTFLTQIPLFF